MIFFMSGKIDLYSHYEQQNETDNVSIKLRCAEIISKQ
jgi:hypothetical protein